MVWTIIIPSLCSVGRCGSSGQFCLVPFMSFLSDGGWGWIICRFDRAWLFQNNLKEGTFTSLAVDSGYCCKFTCSQEHLLVLLHVAKHLLTESWLLHCQSPFTLVQSSKKASGKLLVLLDDSLRTSIASLLPYSLIEQVSLDSDGKELDSTSQWEIINNNGS